MHDCVYNTTICRGAASQGRYYQNSNQEEARSLKQSLPKRERKLITCHDIDNACKRLSVENLYLIIERYHEVAVDWSAVRLVLQRTLFCVQFDLEMPEDGARKLAGNNQGRLVGYDANGVISEPATFSLHFATD